MILIFRKFEKKIKFHQKIGKMMKIRKDSKKLEFASIFLKIADIKILKNIPLHLEAMQ